MLKKAFRFTSILTTIMIVVSCSAVAGTDNSSSINGEDSLAVYLEDSTGNRYYSGSSIYLGYNQFLDPSVKTNYTLNIDGNSSLTLTGGEGNFIQFGGFEEIIEFSTGDGLIFEDISINTEVVSTWNYLTENQDSMNSSVNRDSPSSFSLTFSNTNVNTQDLEIHFRKQLIIPMKIDDETFNFLFEVRGIFTNIPS